MELITDMISSRKHDLERLVHFDLKGAPPNMSYLEKILPLLKQIGATGILLEYEDMFPYEGDLQVVCQPYAYSKDDIKKIQYLAEENFLIVIPLVQSFGHLEFLLKHEDYYYIREIGRYPNALCPSNPKSVVVVMDMVSQILASHPKTKYIHIGADEVWHLGQCLLCKHEMEHNGRKREHLFLDHIKKIVSQINEINPEVCIIIWDDMMRDIDVEVLKESEIGSLVFPMIWHYLPAEEFKLQNSIFEKYANVFPKVWIASAFKGATEMTQFLTPTRYHLANQQAWLKVLKLHANKFKQVIGIAVTGWSRFDHYTVLCELFPVALPTLAVSLLTMEEGEFNEKVHKKASSLLGFEKQIELDNFPRPQPVGPPPHFPGGNIYNSCLHLANCITEHHILMRHPSVEGAFSNYQIMHNRVNTLHIDQFLSRARILLNNLEAINAQLQSEMNKIYHQCVSEEFIAINVQHYLDRLRKLVRDAEQQIIIHLPPFEMKSS